MSNPETPLWQAMRVAYEESDDGTNLNWMRRDGYAAEIRALADWLIPGELDLDNEEAKDLVLWGKWRARTRLRDRLLAEAERAEAGE